MDKIEKIDCTTCKYGYEDERLGIPMCHHPKRFSEDCVDFNMHEEKRLEDRFNKSMEEAAEEYSECIIGREDAFMCKAAFIAGAEWQAAQLLQGAPMPEDTVLHPCHRHHLRACVLAEKDLGWHSVDESLPPVDEEVIVLRNESNGITLPYPYNLTYGHLVADKTIFVEYNGWNVPGVKYWMPMPKLEGEK